MLGLVNESEVVGTNTAAELVEQREKLENISQRCDGIDANLVSAQQNLNKLGSIFGGIKNYFQPPKSSFTKSASQPHLSDAAKKKAAAAQEAAASAVTTRTANPKDNADTYFGKSRDQMDDMERETEEGLRDIHQGVNRLKMLAMHMNQELDSQKPLIEDVHRKVGVLTGDVDVKNKQMKTILLR